MILWDSKTAPNPRRVRIYLAEKGITVPTQQVDIAAKENRAPAFLGKNPLGGVPVLELDDGTCIAESIAICRYFEALHPEPPLFGTGPTDHALVEMWQRRMELSLLLPVSHAFQHTHQFFAGRVRQVPDYGDAAKENAELHLKWLDGQLGDCAYIAGDRYTVADITALCAIDFGRVSGIRIQPDQKNLARWYADVSSRPSAKA
jgi:glutathione S-transferase